MGTVADAVASFERNIAAQTGRPVAEWVTAVRAQGCARHGEMVAWLKSAHGLSHAHANHIAKAALAAAVAPGDDPVALLFEGGKADLRPIYDRLVAVVTGFGADVEIAPKKANVSLRRRKQFALIQPSTKTRVDLGLILPDRAPAGPARGVGSFNAMFTHRVKLGAVAEVDGDVAAWLRAAYDAAG